MRGPGWRRAAAGRTSPASRACGSSWPPAARFARTSRGATTSRAWTRALRTRRAACTCVPDAIACDVDPRTLPAGGRVSPEAVTVEVPWGAAVLQDFAVPRPRGVHAAPGARARGGSSSGGASLGGGCLRRHRAGLAGRSGASSQRRSPGGREGDLSGDRAAPAGGEHPRHHRDFARRHGALLPRENRRGAKRKAAGSLPLAPSSPWE